MHMSFRISLTVPTKRPMCKINVYPKLVIEWFPNPRDLFALRDRVRRNKGGVYRGILHQFGRLIVPPCHIVNFTGSFIRLALFIYINPVFLDYNNEKQWFGRFVLRNNSHIKDFSKWLSHMKDIYDERTGLGFIVKHNPVSFFVLKQNQYLSDIIDDLYWKKQHCDAYIV